MEADIETRQISFASGTCDYDQSLVTCEILNDSQIVAIHLFVRLVALLLKKRIGGGGFKVKVHSGDRCDLKKSAKFDIIARLHQYSLILMESRIANQYVAGLT